MNYFTALMSTPFMSAAGWTIIHSLWIGILVFALVFLCQALWGRSHAARNYQLAFGGQVLLFLLSLGVFIYYFIDSANDVGGATFFMESTSSTQEAGLLLSREWSYLIAQQAPTIALIWLAGMVFLLIKLIIGYRYIHQLRKSSTTVSEPSLQRLVDRIAFILHVKGGCDVRLTDQIISPLLTGLYRPFIVMPMAVINSLEMEEVEMILAHEMAHLKRMDHVALFVQQVIETLLYFNPAIWLLSRQINKYREEACDDLVVARMGRDINYAKSLVKLQELQINQKHQLALSALGQKNQFLNRIKRIMNMETKQRHNFGRIALIMMIPFTFALLSFYTKHEAEPAHVDKLDIPEVTIALAANAMELDTVPTPKSSARVIEKVIKKENGKEIEAEFENDKVNYLKIDGQEVNPDDNAAIVEELRSEISPELILEQPGGNFLFNARDFNFNNEDFEAQFPAIIQDGDMSVFFKSLDADSIYTIFEEFENQHGAFQFKFDNDNSFKFLRDGEMFELDINGESFDLQDFLDAERIEEIRESIPTIEEDGSNMIIESEDGTTVILNLEEVIESSELAKLHAEEISEEVALMMERIEEQSKERAERLERMHDKRNKQMQRMHERRADELARMQEKRAYKLERKAEEMERRLESNNTRREKMLRNMYEIKEMNRGVGLRAAVERALKKDGHVSADGSYSFKLKEGKLKINGKRQSQAVYEKYKMLYEEYSGKSIKGNSYSTSISGI